MHLRSRATIINGYLRLLASVHTKCYVVISQTLTAIINRTSLTPHVHLLSNVSFQLALCIGSYLATVSQEKLASYYEMYNRLVQSE